MSISYSPARSLLDALPRWCIWVVSSILGLFLGLELAELVDPTFFTMAAVLPGIAIGSAQWLFLRPLPRAYLWILVTSLGWPLPAFVFAGSMLGHGMATTVSPASPNPDEFAAALTLALPAVFSIPLALMQFAFLRKRFNRPGMWIPTTVAGWFLASLLIYPARAVRPIYDLVTSISPDCGYLFIMALAAMIPTAVKGAILLSLKPKEATPVSERLTTSMSES